MEQVKKTTMELSDIKDIPLSDIDISNLNVRNVDAARNKIDELAASIKLQGLMQPVVLRGEYGKPPYDLIIGQRRYLAHQSLGRKNIKAVFSGKMDDTNAIIFSLVENMQRVQLNHADAAEAVTKLYRKYDKDEKKVKDATGLSLRTIREYINIEEQASSKAKQYLKKGRISKADLKRILQIAQGHIKKADELLDEIVRLTKYEKDRAVEYSLKNPKASAKDIVKEAKKPRAEETIVLNLGQNLTTALRLAMNDLSLEKESLALNLIEDWLRNNGYLN